MPYDCGIDDILNNIFAPLSQKKRKMGAPVRPGRICRILDGAKIDCLKEENVDILWLKFLV